ncbi:MAG: hypothetical protein H0U73_04145 [Tatlockia sp.]|nr:hypothetical protein [Tatlockia sp.]
MKHKSDLDSDLLPKWQTNLIQQILNATNDYYCLPKKFDLRKESLKFLLVK